LDAVVAAALRTLLPPVPFVVAWRAGEQVEAEQRLRAHAAALAATEKELEEQQRRGGKLDNYAAKVDAASMEQRVRGNRFYAQRDASDAATFMRK
jgi:hypothetical protein